MTGLFILSKINAVIRKSKIGKITQRKANDFIYGKFKNCLLVLIIYIIIIQ